MYNTIRFDIHEAGYAQMTLSRPDQRNAVSLEMVEELKDALERAKEADIKCLVVTGEGSDAFCSGGDLYDFHADLTSEDVFSTLYKMKEFLYDLARFPLPTLAILNGHALGGGCELATACDFRYGPEWASYGFIQGRLGIIPGWGGGALLYKRLPSLVAYRMLVESKPFSAAQCLEMGWLQDIYDQSFIKEEMERILQPFLSKSTDQIKEFKQQYIRYEFPISLSVEMDEEVRRCSTLWGNDQHKKAVNSFLTEKNK
ncbi:enoyl-CoA hydratase/isomerase family protein [Pontibacillus yanchengensis]|uniref:Enoyl-CoA hydratase/isomerase family protein n=2 Tax=Pontibacillus yanchengensis TaxID=462910 RepID=A0ACC7VB95_9BACI|nr:enoyl-CoA hydratase/isomerase family protein [Pontibacillus yanchengensis]MYL33034.1 enoyl-CoA hydratase/isomerase family protein [Pontibacillus yanchengensis]MYL52116.1 enoyl-CoA hydratase/isomerase family protein [Pontibacillus yanchengensis]